MTLEPGTSLLHYRIVDKIGEGGMGVVWKALDTTLDRTVAIKVLPASFGEEPERLARFEREAKALAALNHPNVASLFGLHEFEGTRFITMEFVEGEDLSKRIRRGALPVEEAVPIAIGIAEALSAAHAQGIVHRDLKPANVLIDPEGTPKVLDFGLAKTAMPDTMSSGGSSDPSASPTITSLGTVAGVLLGTAAYMSPEQARGKPVDKRADTWALGCILYEMLTGKTPFPGETISDTLASVLKTEPDWDALPSAVPGKLLDILRRAMAKHARDRWQDAGDLRYELERFLDSPQDRGAPKELPTNRNIVPKAAGLLLGGLALGVLLGHWFLGRSAPAAPPREQTVSELSAPEGVAFGVRAVELSLSPDGNQLVFAGVADDGVQRLYLRSLTSSGSRSLPGTEDAHEPFWSSDGTQIAFHTARGMFRIGLDDAQPTKIIDDSGASGAWNADGLILYCPSSGSGALQLVDTETGRQEKLPHTQFGDSGCDSVSFLDDGQHYLFEARDSSLDAGVFLGKLGLDRITRLSSLKTNAVYSVGHMLFHEGPQLMAQKIDAQAGKLVGDPFVVANPVFDLNFPFHALFTAARERPRIVYLEGTGVALQTELTWFDREGAEVERTGIVGDLYSPSLSKDARRLLLDVSTYDTEGDIWWFDMARGSSRRLTDDPIDESRPLWSADEKAAYFFRVPDLYRFDLTGNAGPVRIVESERIKVPSDVRADGTLLFSESQGGHRDLFYIDLETETVSTWLASPFDEADAAFSPDGNWVAYQSNESGRPEVYVDRFPDPGERFRVSRDGGTNPTWRGDGREIYYVSPTATIMAVPVDLDSERQPIGVPEMLFRPNIRRDMYAPHPDGQRFLVVERLDPKIHRAFLVDDWN